MFFLWKGTVGNMKKSFNHVIKYIVGENDQGVYFNRSDIFTLLFLYEQKTVSQIQLRNFYDLVNVEPIKRTTFVSKLSKWEKMRLIKKENMSVRKKRGFILDFVSIAGKGAELLYRLKLVSESNIAFISKRQYEHNIAITQFVLNMLESESKNEYTGAVVGGNGDYLFPLNKKVQENLQFPNIIYSDSATDGVYYLYEDEEYREVMQPELHPISFQQDLPHLVYSSRPPKNMYPDEHGNPIIIPDWFMKCNNSFINIEVDTGTENIPFLINKLKKYLEVAHDDPAKRYVVLFSVIDDSYHTISSYKKRSVRVTNLKKAFGSIPRLQVVDNIDIYVCNMGSSALVVQHILQQIRENKNSNHLIEEIVNHLHINSSFQYSAELITCKNAMKSKGLSHTKLLESTDNLLILKKVKEEYENISVSFLEILFVIHILKIGEVNSHQRLLELSGLLAMQNEHRKLNPIHILGIYEADEIEQGQQTIKNDVFHNSIRSENILLASSAEMLNSIAAFYTVKERVKQEFGECSSKEC